MTDFNLLHARVFYNSSYRGGLSEEYVQRNLESLFTYLG